MLVWYLWFYTFYIIFEKFLRKGIVMTQIKDVMSVNTQFITPETTLQAAAQIMAEQDLGFLPVGKNDRLIGMITDRDITVRATAQGRNPAEATARDVMTQKTYYCYEDQSTEEICQNMSEVKVRRFPVVNRDKRLVGVVSFGDLAQQVSAQTVGETEQSITAGCASKAANAA